jgi:hypothetical protein
MKACGSIRRTTGAQGIPRGPMGRGPPSGCERASDLPLRVDALAPVQQEPRQLDVALLRRLDETRDPVLRGGGWGGKGLCKLQGGGGVRDSDTQAGRGGLEPERKELGLPHGSGGPAGLAEGEAAVGRGEEARAAPPVVRVTVALDLQGRVDVCAPVEQQPRHLEVAVLGRNEEAGGALLRGVQGQGGGVRRVSTAPVGRERARARLPFHCSGGVSFYCGRDIRRSGGGELEGGIADHAGDAATGAGRAGARI